MFNKTSTFKITDQYAKAFFEAFIIALVIVWLPFKLFAYLAPFISITWFIIRANSTRALLRFVTLLFIYAILISAYQLFYSFMGEEFIIQNTFLFLLTYGSFLFLMIVPRDAGLYKQDYHRYLKVMKVFILIESALGIFQVFAFSIINGVGLDFGTGDVAQGTLSPLSFLEPVGSFNNQIYCNNLLVLLLFYIPYTISTRKDIWVVLLGFTAVMLASVLHLFLAFFIAIVFIALYFSRSFIKISTTRILVVSALVLTISASVVLQPNNFALIAFYFERMVTNQSPKTIVTVNSITKLPTDFPWVYTIGLGPGQYSSRAGLIGTGHYFGDFNKPKEVPLITNSVSAPLKKYTYTHWKDYATNPKYGSSTMSRPFYSALSVLMELGYIITAALLVSIVRRVSGIKRIYESMLKKNRSLVAFYAFACAAFVLYFMFISFFENYMEVTQAIFPGLILYRYFYDYIKDNSIKEN